MTDYKKSVLSCTREKSLNNNNKGFSLVELSIVLVILGLLTGGILTGQNLIRAAELRSITTEYQAYQAAVNTFRDKYFALPGDMTNAGDFWGMADTSGTGGECGDPQNDTGIGTQTCNGNGDGAVAITSLAANSYEAFRFWQHLSNAGLIEGSFTGVNDPTQHAQEGAILGENIPRGKISGSGYFITNLGIQSASTGYFDGEYGNVFHFGADTSSGPSVYYPLLRPEEMWNVDTKIDDGRPGFGKFRGFKSTASHTPNCTTTASKDTSEYNLANSSILCSAIFVNIF